MISSEEHRALCVEANAAVEAAAVEALERLRGRGEPFYPPNGGLTDEERDALPRLDSAAAESAMRKVLADAAASAMFRVFCVIDGVGDPVAFDGAWAAYGIAEAEEDVPFLHDGMLDAYWDWRDIRPDPGWRLDMLT